MEDFDKAFAYIEELWDYNTYNREATRRVYEEILNDPDSFVFFLTDDAGKFHGFCHGCFFNTFWLAGRTCYVSGIITNAGERGQGNGIRIMDHVRELAKKKGCRGIVLDSGLPRKQAHIFYEKYGFQKSCYGFDYMLTEN